MFVDFNILNQLGSPSINSNTFANRPAAGQTGRLFVSTDTFEIYRDNGTTWDLIGGPGSSTITGTGQATEVAFFTSSQAISSSANLFWDNTNQYLGIGTSVPNAGVNVQDVDALGVLSNITTVVGTSTSSVSVWGKNTTNSSGYAGIFEEITPNSSSGQYPVLIRHTLSSGTAAANMATGIHFGLPDNAGTERINQFSMDTVDAAAATYSSRYRFLLRSNGAAVTPFYITGTGLGVFTATPGAALDIHSTGTIAQFNTTAATGNVFLAIQRSGTGLWRIGDTYNGGSNFFEIHNIALANNAIQIDAATNKSIFTSIQNYVSGLARANYFDYTLNLPNGTTISSPNAVTTLGATLNLNIAGSATLPNGARSGMDVFNGVNFTSAGTFTINQSSTIRAFSNLTSGWAFNGSAIGTITHLAGMRVLFPTNSGTAINVTTNYGLLINDQTANTGTITYTNRWGIYQEGASDLNYMAANLLLGSTVNSGEKLQVTGTAFVSSTLTALNFVASAGNNTTILNAPNATTGWLQIAMNNTSGSALLGVEGIAAGTLATGTTAYATVLRNYTATDLQIATNNIVRTTITAAGLVGIKTSTPSGLLQLNDVLATPSDAANLTIKQSGTTYTDGIYLERTGERNGYYMYIGGAVDSLNFRRNYFGTQSDVMSLTRDGLVGIGTSNPSSLKVTIENNGGNLRLRNTNTRYRADFVMNTTELGINSYDDTSAVYMPISIEGSKIQLQQGNVLIGTTTDTGQKLQVNGDIKTAAPTTGTAAAWKLGQRVAAAVVLDATQYIEVEVGGTFYKLAVVT